MTDIKVIAHTHWDKEWYFTDNRSMVFSLIDFDEIIDYLSNHDDISTFLLDGQTSIIEDYLRYRPENKDQLKELISKGKIITGPWYTQSDTLVISGESLIRNLQIGMKQATDLGGYQSIGYLPDSFGMSEQMPLLYNQMGLKYAFFRRGIADHLIKDREFNWISPSGESVKAFNLYHYGIMAYPPNEDDGSYIEELVDKLKKFGNRKPYILFNGEDQKPIRKNIAKIIQNSDYDIEIDSLENSLDEVFENANDLADYTGEFTFGQHSRTHKSIFSTRADLKIKHNRLERYLSEFTEPLSAISYKLGLRYEKELIEECFKLMLLNSAHDSIGMCNSDKTNNFIENRYDKVNDISSNLADSIMRRIGDGINLRPFSFQVYNTLPYTREEYIKCNILTPFENFSIERDGKPIDFELMKIEEDKTNLSKSIKEIGVNNELSSDLNAYKKIYSAEILIKDELTPMGYQTYEIKESFEKFEMKVTNNNNFIENEFYKISVGEDGQIIVKGDSNISKIYLENNGDEGDSYDYSSPNKDLFISKGKVSDIKVRKNKFCQNISYKITRRVPSNLENRISKILDEKLVSHISLTLYKSKKYIELNYKTKNNVIEHRDRVVIDSKVESRNSIADQQFGTIVREVDYSKYKNWTKDGWDEKPRGIEPMISFACLDSKQSVCGVCDGVREYELLDNHKLAFTIFRSVPYLGKANLNDRPGRASGVHEIQMGHALLDTEIETTLYICDIENDYFKMHDFSKKVLNKAISYQAGEIYDNTDHFVISKNYNCPSNYSLLEVDGAIFSSLKQATNDNDLILRLYNPYRDKDINFKTNIDKLDFVKADEISKDQANNFIRPCGIKTIKIKNQ